MPTENMKRQARYMPHQAAHTSEAIQQPAAKPCTHSINIEAREVADGHKNKCLPNTLYRSYVGKRTLKNWYVELF